MLLPSNANEMKTHKKKKKMYKIVARQFPTAAAAAARRNGFRTIGRDKAHIVSHRHRSVASEGNTTNRERRRNQLLSYIATGRDIPLPGRPCRHGSSAMFPRKTDGGKNSRLAGRPSSKVYVSCQYCVIAVRILLTRCV